MYCTVSTSPPLDLRLELFALLSPADLLAGEARDERRGGLHLAAAGFGLVEELLLGAHGRLVLGLDGVQLALLLVELLLRLGEVRHGRVQLPLLHRERSLQRQHLRAEHTPKLLYNKICSNAANNCATTSILSLNY